MFVCLSFKKSVSLIWDEQSTILRTKNTDVNTIKALFLTHLVYLLK